jgi:rubrerythrin
MNMPQNIVLELAENELAVHDLYKHYAKTFPDLKDFWDHIAKDEMDHCETLKELNDLQINGEVVIDNNRFQIEAIESARRYLQEKIAEQNPNLGEALLNARKIEDSLLEKDVFKIFETDSPVLKSALGFINQETKKHLEAVQAKYAELYSAQ